MHECIAYVCRRVSMCGTSAYICDAFMHAYIHRGAEQALPAQRPHQARAARADCRGAGAQYIQTYMHASMNAGRQACAHACIQGLLHLGLPQVLPVASQSRLHRQCQAAEAGGIEVSRAPSAGKPTCLHIMCVCVCVCVCVYLSIYWLYIY